MNEHARADEARLALAERYRQIGSALLARAQWLEVASLDEISAQPVPYRHSGARAEEEALDAALTAL